MQDSSKFKGEFHSRDEASLVCGGLLQLLRSHHLTQLILSLLPLYSSPQGVRQRILTMILLHGQQVQRLRLQPWTVL